MQPIYTFLHDQLLIHDQASLLGPQMLFLVRSAGSVGVVGTDWVVCGYNNRKLLAFVPLEMAELAFAFLLSSFVGSPSTSTSQRRQVRLQHWSLPLGSFSPWSLRPRLQIAAAEVAVVAAVELAEAGTFAEEEPQSLAQIRCQCCNFAAAGLRELRKCFATPAVQTGRGLDEVGSLVSY